MVTGELSAEQVVTASNAWIWVPDNAATKETSEYLLVRFPEWAERELVVVRFDPERPIPEVLGEVLAHASSTGLAEVAFWVKIDADPMLEPMLQHLGGDLVETVDVLACDLTAGVPDLGETDVEARWVDDLDTIRDSHTILSTVFGGEVPPEQRLQLEAWQSAADVRDGLGGGIVAYRDGRAVGSGGLTIADGVARLWSGSVLPEHRGAGAYRALLRARLSYAVEHGCHLGLVKGRVDTSGPILRRAGFSEYGQERCYVLPLNR